MKTFVTKMALVSALLVPVTGLANFNTKYGPKEYEKDYKDLQVEVKNAPLVVDMHVGTGIAHINLIDDELARIRKEIKDLRKDIDTQQDKLVEAKMASIKDLNEEDRKATAELLKTRLEKQYAPALAKLTKKEVELNKWRRKALRIDVGYKAPHFIQVDDALVRSEESLDRALVAMSQATKDHTEENVAHLSTALTNVQNAKELAEKVNLVAIKTFYDVINNGFADKNIEEIEKIRTELENNNLLKSKIEIAKPEKSKKTRSRRSNDDDEDDYEYVAPVSDPFAGAAAESGDGF